MPRVQFTRKKPWLDRRAGVYRKQGEQTDVSAERAKIIVRSGAGKVVGEMKADTGSNKTESSEAETPKPKRKSKKKG